MCRTAHWEPVDRHYCSFWTCNRIKFLLCLFLGPNGLRDSSDPIYIHGLLCGSDTCHKIRCVFNSTQVSRLTSYWSTIKVKLNFLGQLSGRGFRGEHKCIEFKVKNKSRWGALQIMIYIFVNTFRDYLLHSFEQCVQNWWAITVKVKIFWLAVIAWPVPEKAHAGAALTCGILGFGPCKIKIITDVINRAWC